MINKRSKQYCCEPLNLIENYELAINDKTQTWVIHHRLEITNNGHNLNMNELKRLGLYYNRPASELIFLTKSEHARLHRMNRSDDEKNKRIESIRQYYNSEKFQIWKANRVGMTYKHTDEYYKNKAIRDAEKERIRKEKIEIKKNTPIIGWSKGMKGEGTPHYGKKHSLQTKELMSKQRKGVKKNKCYFINSIGEILITTYRCGLKKTNFKLMSKEEYDKKMTFYLSLCKQNSEFFANFSTKNYKKAPKIMFLTHTGETKITTYVIGNERNKWSPIKIV